MRRIVLGAILMITLSVFGLQHGFGGFTLFYVPGGNLIQGIENIPDLVGKVSDFQSGILAYGGMGFGGAPRFGYSFGAGFGGEREYIFSTEDGKATFKISVGGGFGGFGKAADFGTFGVLATLGIGGVNFLIERKVNEGNTTLENLKNGTLEGYLGAEISYFALFPGLQLYIQVIDPLLSIGTGIVGMIGYSDKGWTVNNKSLQNVNNDLYRFYSGYTIYLGVYFGG